MIEKRLDNRLKVIGKQNGVQVKEMITNDTIGLASLVFFVQMNRHEKYRLEICSLV